MPPEGPLGVTVTVEGWESPSDLGIVVAEQRGFFEDVGLNVWVGTPGTPNRSVSYVLSGTDEFGVAQMPEVAIAKEKGLPVVAVGSLVSQPTTAMIWLKKSKIRTLSGLKGKTIAINGSLYQERLLETVLARAGLTLDQVHVKSVGYNLVPALLSGKADAILGGSWNLEGVELKKRGADPVITRMSGIGAPSYEELVVIVRRDLAEEYPEFVQKFLSAVVRGTEVAVKHPKAAIRMAMKADERNPHVGLKAISAQTRATLPLLSRSGRIDPEKASDLVGWMQEQGMIRESSSVSGLLTNRYLPAQP